MQHTTAPDFHLASASPRRRELLRQLGYRFAVLQVDIDESPQAYKAIDEVITAQHDLVDVIGKFTPRIVRMADEPGDI